MPETVTLARRGSSRPEAIELIGHSSAIVRVRESLARAVTLNGGVLVVAEAGTCVEEVVRALHQHRSPDAPFVVVDCAHDTGCLEAALFGAVTAAGGDDLESVAPDCRLAAACGGTLFLQDVVELPASVQARLARIARDGEASIAGRTVPMTWRLVASAAPGIEGDVQARRFRPDLFRRLSSTRIDLPPLRDRADDLPALATRMLNDACQARNLPERAFTQAALALLSVLPWPGNAEELRGVIDRIAADGPAGLIQIEQLFPLVKLRRVSERFVPIGNLREARLRFEREYIAAVLQHHDWRMTEAARTLGMQRPNLYRKARQLGLMIGRVSE